MLEIENLGHSYGSGPDAQPVLADLGFTVPEGQLTCIVGPSGCGKTTLLRSLSGLMRPTSGRVRVAGRPVDGVPDNLALVFQDYSRSLFPWMSVRSNVEFPLERGPLSRAERRERAAGALASVGLDGAGDKYPWQLSGGMQQRVAIARALAYRPQVLLMDEPFASVDAQTRGDLEDLVLRVRAQHAMTILFVTHDIDESVYLGDRILVLSAGPARIRADRPVELPAQRDQIATRELDAFVHLRGEIGRLIRDSKNAGEADSFVDTAGTPLTAS